MTGLPATRYRATRRGAQPVVFIEAVTSTNPSGGTSVNVALPPNGQVGDLVVIFTGVYNGNANVPSGWTLIAQTTNGSRARITTMQRILDGTEGATVTVTVTNNDSTVHAACLFRGVNAANPIDVSASNSAAATSSQVTPTVTTTAAVPVGLGLIVRAAASYRAALSGNYTWPAGWTEVVDAQANTSGDPTLATLGVAVRTPTTVGAQGTVTATHTASQTYGAVTMGLRVK
ncbi:hypothetical protein [Gordonia sp. OPL2]|uniref:hypothetical protein n=1 Tax=Gordonia sp. OPL2 TaxID=2486274 RepID=UPI001655687D|nr:hypothetical protein [Gordonia sp. OPL2]ROZ89029.1 hypothetical protein EEB19_20190 [Gordonia sp. OPL2]